MLDDTAIRYDDACFFVEDEAPRQPAARPAERPDEAALLDPRLFLAFAAVALAVAVEGSLPVAACLAAGGALLLSLWRRPRLDARHASEGAFDALSLGILLWLTGPREALSGSGRRMIAIGLGGFGAATLAVIAIGVAGTPVQVMAVAAAGLVVLAGLRRAFAGLVLNGAA